VWGPAAGAPSIAMAIGIETRNPSTSFGFNGTWNGIGSIPA
jgi:hypothetical protein